MPLIIKNNQDIIILEDGKKIIKKIFHISDIHIYKYDRHDEFREVFNNLFKKLHNDAKPYKNSLIVITGDILDRGLDISPESIELLQDLYIGLTNICDTITINGNHEYKGSCINNYLNPLFPYIEKTFNSKSKLSNKNYILNENVNYIYNNIIFGVTTCFAKEVTKCDIKTNKIKIGLYHGTLYKSIACNGFEFTNKNNFNCASFSDYDYVLLGDIHKHQYMNKKKTIAYAGSLIQLKRDEDPDEHGYIRWDLENKTSKFIKIKNNKVKLEINYEDGINLDDLMLSKDIDLKINYKSSVNKNDLNNFIKKIKENLVNTGKLKCTNIIDYSSSKLKLDIKIDGKEISIIKINNNNDILNLVMNYAKNECEYDENILLNMKNVLSDSLNEIEYNYKKEIKNINLNYVKFDNIFIYGYDNSVNFNKFDKIIGLNSPNYSGKSSFIDIILFSIFGKHTKGDCDRKSALKIGQVKLKTEISLNVNNNNYVIERIYKRHSQKNANKYGEYYVKIFKNKEKIIEINKMDEYKDVVNYINTNICSFEELLQQSIILQLNDKSFITLTSTVRNNERRDYLLKILNLDFFNKIYENINKLKNSNITKKKNINGILKKMDTNVNTKNIGELNLVLDNYNKDVEEINDNINKLNENLSNKNKIYEEYKNSFLKNKLILGDKTTDFITNEISETTLKIKNIKNLLITNKNKCNSLNNLIKQNVSYINKLQNEFDMYNKKKINKLENIEKSCGFIFNKDDYNKLKVNLENIQKKIKELESKIEKKNKNKIKINEKEIIEIEMQYKNYISNEKQIIEIEDKIQINKDNLNDLKDFNYNKNCKECLSNSFIKEKIKYENKQIILIKNLKKIKKLLENINKKYPKIQNIVEELNKNNLKNKNIELEINKLTSELNNNKEKEIFINDKIKLYNSFNNNLEILYESIIRKENLLKKYDIIHYNFILFNLEQNKYLCNSNKNELLKIISKNNNLKNELELLQKKKTEQVNLLDVIKNTNIIENKIDIIKDEINKINNEKELKNNNLQNLLLKIKNLKIYISELDDIENNISNCNNIINLFKCNKKGEGIIDHIISTNILPYLEEMINNILKIINSHMFIKLEMNNSLIDIKINKNNYYIDAANISGYEYDLLNFIFRLSIGNINNIINFNFLIIDEGLKFSDNNNKEIIKKLIEYMRDSYKWIIMISHDNFIKTFYDSELKIKKISEIESNLIN